MTEHERQISHELLARAIFSSGSPLSLVENNDWINFMKHLKPAYKMPCRHTLSNKLLESEYQRVEALTQEKISEASSIALQCDAWTNIRN